MAPTVLGYLVLGDVVAGALFQTGQFGRIDTVAVWIVLGGYAIGLLATTASRLLQSALYGAGDTRTPARVAILRVSVSATLGVVLMLQLDRFAVTTNGVQLLGQLPAFSPLPGAVRDAAGGGELVRLGAAGLAMAASVGAWLEYVLLRRTVRRRVGAFTPRWKDRRPIAFGLLSALGAAVIVRFIVSDLPALPGGLLAVSLTTAVHLGVAAATGSHEIRTAGTAVHRRLRALWPGTP